MWMGQLSILSYQKWNWSSCNIPGTGEVLHTNFSARNYFWSYLGIRAPNHGMAWRANRNISSLLDCCDSLLVSFQVCLPWKSFSTCSKGDGVFKWWTWEYCPSKLVHTFTFKWRKPGINCRKLWKEHNEYVSRHLREQWRLRKSRDADMLNKLKLGLECLQISCSLWL